ncbi:hypothetical protein AX16_002467 [Volvariella volvacea WC 439]|nr:hypothetical protein AX16_002467 [Volvariella volvacea WC 439]
MPSKSGGHAHGHSSTPMTKEAASRIQSSQAKAGHDTGVGSFAARVQSAADRNASAASQASPSSAPTSSSQSTAGGQGEKNFVIGTEGFDIYTILRGGLPLIPSRYFSLFNMHKPKNPKNPMTPEAAMRIQANAAKKGNALDDWAARAQAAAARNAHAAKAASNKTSSGKGSSTKGSSGRSGGARK